MICWDMMSLSLISMALCGTELTLLQALKRPFTNWWKTLKTLYCFTQTVVIAVLNIHSGVSRSGFREQFLLRSIKRSNILSEKSTCIILLSWHRGIWQHSSRSMKKWWKFWHLVTRDWTKNFIKQGFMVQSCLRRKRMEWRKRSLVSIRLIQMWKQLSKDLALSLVSEKSQSQVCTLQILMYFSLQPMKIILLSVAKAWG